MLRYNQNNVKVITKEGECTVNLNLEIVIKMEAGNLVVATQVNQQPQQQFNPVPPPPVIDQSEQTKKEFDIPEFKPTKGNFKFGKSV